MRLHHLNSWTSCSFFVCLNPITYAFNLVFDHPCGTASSSSWAVTAVTVSLYGYTLNKQTSDAAASVAAPAALKCLNAPIWSANVVSFSTSLSGSPSENKTTAPRLPAAAGDEPAAAPALGPACSVNTSNSDEAGEDKLTQTHQNRSQQTVDGKGWALPRRRAKLSSMIWVSAAHTHFNGPCGARHGLQASTWQRQWQWQG